MVVDSDAVLPCTVALERFEPVARWHPEIGEPPGNLKLTKLAPHHGFDAREPRHRMTVRQALCAVVPKRNDHWDSNVVRYYRQA